MKKLLLLALAIPAIVFGQSYPSPTFNSIILQNPLTPANGGTGATSSTGTGSVVLSNSPSLANPTITGSLTATGLVTLPSLAAQAANTVLANATGSTANVVAFAMPTCTAATCALSYTPGTGFTTNSAINAATLGGATFAAPGNIGTGTPGSGAFTTLSANTPAAGSNSTNVATTAFVRNMFGIFTPQMFVANAGSGGDDSSAINQAIAAAVSNTGPTTGLVYLPPPSSGYYNICSSTLILPSSTTGAAISLRIEGPSGGGAPIRILPGCASPPQSVMTVPINQSANSNNRFHLNNITLDGYCLAYHNLDIEYAVGFSASNSVFRNVAQAPTTGGSLDGGSNIYIKGGYEMDFSTNNRMENVNDAGHLCYTSASTLPYYNLDMNGTDSYFTNMIGIDAYVANFYNGNGGDNHMRGAHGWGYVSDPNYSVNLVPQYNFITLGPEDLNNTIADGPKNAGWWLRGLGGTTSNARITNSVMYNVIGNATSVIMDSGITGALVNGVTVLGGSVGNVITQSGSANITTNVYGNPGATYDTGLQTNFTTGTSLTSNANANVTSISLPAGVWDVWGVVVFNPASNTTVGNLVAGANTTSAMFGANGTFSNLNTPFTTGAVQRFQSPPSRMSFASTTTVYLVAQATFGVSTMTADGYIFARRAD
ncbi:hypothetical protein AAB988_29385 [Burkholderia contaminans]|uniref:hypothetical protein n=1 Tax=Burkholderia contaminans TaxID=488447 RepID=UPI003113BDC4